MAGVVLAGVVTTLIAVQLFRELARDQTLRQLRQEASGIAQLYSDAVKADFGAKEKNQRVRAPDFAAKSLEKATGDLIFYDGPINLFPGEKSGFERGRRLNLKSIDWTSGETLTFEFTPPGHRGTYYAVARPVKIHNTSIGAIVVAKKKTSVSHSVSQLVRRLALAGLLGLLAAGVLAFFFSRRIVRPVLSLSKAAD